MPTTRPAVYEEIFHLMSLIYVFSPRDAKSHAALWLIIYDTNILAVTLDMSRTFACLPPCLNFVPAHFTRIEVLYLYDLTALAAIS
jgi:hypothetical protein